MHANLFTVLMAHRMTCGIEGKVTFTMECVLVTRSGRAAQRLRIDDC